MKDYYHILGIAKNATTDEVKQAYKKLAMKHHPDRGGDAGMFQDISEAYSTLSDAAKRAEYDNPRTNSGVHVNFSHGSPFGNDFASAAFQQFFNQHHQQQKPQQRLTLWIGLDVAIQGGKQTIVVATHQGRSTIEIDIPVAIADGSAVRYPGIAQGGLDIIITFRVHPHPKWERKGLDLWTVVDADFWQLITGGNGIVNTVLGNALTFTIPPKSNPNAILRLKGQGIQTNAASGDMYIRLQATMPANIPTEILEILSSLPK